MRASLSLSKNRSWLLAGACLMVLSASTALSIPAHAAKAPWQLVEDEDVRATPISTHERLAIRQVIERQMAAFQKDDGDAAFNLATRQLRAQFGSVQNFMSAVRSNYQAVYHPTQVSFGKIEAIDGIPVAHVILIGEDGNVSEALYFMKHEKDGNWRIDGCMLSDSDLKSS